MIPMLTKDWSDADGSWKLGVISRSMVTPCLVKNVMGCWKTMAYTKHVAHIGMSLSTLFASSTSVKVQTLPSSFDPSGASMALFRNLVNKLKG